nr:TIGR04283 family arsenosugar biosynthesis glycosyltransferase [uncultured Brevundimonas sp.]
MLVAVIPALNAADSLPATLEPLRGARIVVSDGGSKDGTRAVAADMGAIAVRAPCGRGAQLARGAERALALGATWLLFLHADARLPDDWRRHTDRHQKHAPHKAAAFRLSFDDEGAPARRLARIANWRSRAGGLPWGDQGLLISAALYRDIGGFRPLPLMEDVDLVRRLGRGRIALLDAAIVVSAARYRKDGWWLRPCRNLILLGLYFCGVSPKRLARVYGYPP